MSERIECPEGVLRHDEARRRYVYEVDGAVIGFTEYRPRDHDVLVFPHTVTKPEWRGRGVAAKVVQFALDDVRVQGKRVVASCPYVARHIEEHSENSDLLAG